jgi:hypothetical protein
MNVVLFYKSLIIGQKQAIQINTFSDLVKVFYRYKINEVIISNKEVREEEIQMIINVLPPETKVGLYSKTLKLERVERLNKFRYYPYEGMILYLFQIPSITSAFIKTGLLLANKVE